MNQGLTSDEINTILELKVKANDEQVRTIRGIFEGEWKERVIRRDNNLDRNIETDAQRNQRWESEQKVKR